MGLLVNDFLVANFWDIVDYHFTASVEEQFDEIAHGKLVWNKMIADFYGPFHAEVDKAVDEADRVTWERELWKHPKSWKVVLARMWRYGPLVQIWDQEDEDKKFAKIRPGWHLEDITLEQALECFALPRDFGEYKGETMQVNIGRFGPYVRRGSTFASIPKVTEETPWDDPYVITEERAIEILEAKLKKDKEKVINTFEHEGEKVVVENGRRWPFVRYGKKNLKLSKEQKAEPKKITMKDILKLLKDQK